MLCTIYKSSKKDQTYLFIEKRDDFSKVPDALMAMFGTPVLVTIINLATKDKLGFADLAKVKQNLTDEGFYLQLPPPKEDMLKAHKAQMTSQQLSATQTNNAQEKSQ